MAAVLLAAFLSAACPNNPAPAGGQVDLTNKTSRRILAFVVTKDVYETQGDAIAGESAEAYTALSSNTYFDGAYYKTIHPYGSKTWVFSENTGAVYAAMLLDQNNERQDAGPEYLSLSGNSVRSVAIREPPVNSGNL
jgi:hypothetical protein